MYRISVKDACTVEDFISGHPDLIAEKRSKSPCVGLVRLIQNGMVVSTDQSPEGWLTNVTVGIGREFIAQRVFNLPSGRAANLAGPTTIDVKGLSVSHFGIGGGGSIAGPTLVTPTVADTKLNTPIEFNLAALDYDSGTGIQIKAAKPITSGGSILFQTDPLSNNNFSTVKCTCVVAASEPYKNELGAILTTGQTAKIDESMLFATAGGTAPIVPFAHISFMPKYVEYESTLTIEWVVLF